MCERMDNVVDTQRNRHADRATDRQIGQWVMCYIGSCKT